MHHFVGVEKSKNPTVQNPKRDTVRAHYILEGDSSGKLTMSGARHNGHEFLLHLARQPAWKTWLHAVTHASACTHSSMQMGHSPTTSFGGGGIGMSTLSSRRRHTTTANDSTHTKHIAIMKSRGVSSSRLVLIRSMVWNVFFIAF